MASPRPLISISTLILCETERALSPLQKTFTSMPWHELLGRWQRPARTVGWLYSIAGCIRGMEPGDYVVHREHGIAQYLGLSIAS